MDWRLSLGLCLDLIVTVLSSIIDIPDHTTLEPSFDSPMANVTVKELTTAILPCSVKFLGGHEVIWTDQWSTLLTFEDRRIIDDERMSVERPFIKDWNLHIRNVQHSDQGLYNCQINTDPVKIKTVNLKVQVPPKILNNASTDALAAREGTTVTLMCNVSGIPTPTVTWQRMTIDEKGEEKKSEFCPDTTRIGISGDVLLIHNASRHCGGVYKCIADNGVQPAASKYIRVSVEYPPEIHLPNERIGQVRDKDTILECIISANPQAIGIWKKDGRELKTLSGKYRIEAYPDENQSITVSLLIQILDEADFGTYICEASNKLGKASGMMELYDYAPYRHPSTLPFTTTTPATTNAPLLYPSRHPQQQRHSHSHEQQPKVVKDSHLSYDTNRPNYSPVAVDQSDPMGSRGDSSSTSLLPNAFMIVGAAILASYVYQPPSNSQHNQL